MALTYLIDAPAFNKNVGGICALHYLAHALSQVGEKNVYLTNHVVNPRWESNGINRDAPFFLQGKEDGPSKFYRFLSKLKQYVVFATFKRKITRLQGRLFPALLWNHFDRDRTVVIYGETVRGNPLKAENVVRWIMNTPGVCGGDGVYELTDHIFQYHTAFKVDVKYQIKGLLIALDLEHQLKAYQNQNLPTRKGGAYLVRKGRDKELNQHPADFVHADPLLEKMSDEEAAQFFNSIETFISYDDMTFISVQAALCGCKSIIIPGEGDRSLESLKKINRLNGIAYGFDDQDWSEGTSQLLRPWLENMNSENLATIKAFREYCEKNIPSIGQK